MPSQVEYLLKFLIITLLLLEHGVQATAVRQSTPDILGKCVPVRCLEDGLHKKCNYTMTGTPREMTCQAYIQLFCKAATHGEKLGCNVDVLSLECIDCSLAAKYCKLYEKGLEHHNQFNPYSHASTTWMSRVRTITKTRAFHFLSYFVDGVFASCEKRAVQSMSTSL